MFSLWQKTAFDNLFKEVQNQAVRQKLLDELSQGNLEVGQKINYCLQTYPEELSIKEINEVSKYLLITRQEEDFILYLEEYQPATM